MKHQLRYLKSNQMLDQKKREGISPCPSKSFPIYALVRMSLKCCCSTNSENVDAVVRARQTPIQPVKGLMYVHTRSAHLL